MTTTRQVSKVLPFEGKQGHVQGHEVARIQPDWLKSPVLYVVFEQWDDEAKMMLDVLVHWTKVSQYAKRKWPSGGSVEAVICENGQRIHCTGYSTAGWSVHTTAPGWNYCTAPIIARDVFKVATLGNRETLWEVVGVEAWARSKRDEAATAEHLACPWERDNREFQARMARNGQ